MKYKINNKDAELKLNTDEQVTFFQKNANFDVAKKNWGFYLTPSLQSRCLKKGYKAHLLKKKNTVYLAFLHKSKKINSINKFFNIKKKKIIEIYKSNKFKVFFN